MVLYIRMALYALFVTLANQGVEFYDPETEQFSFSLDDLVMFLTGATGFVATFITSRFSRPENR